MHHGMQMRAFFCRCCRGDTPLLYTIYLPTKISHRGYIQVYPQGWGHSKIAGYILYGARGGSTSSERSSRNNDNSWWQDFERYLFHALNQTPHGEFCSMNQLRGFDGRGHF